MVLPDPDFLEKVIPEGFNSLPLDEQIAICKQHKGWSVLGEGGWRRGWIGLFFRFDGCFRS